MQKLQYTRYSTRLPGKISSLGKDMMRISSYIHIKVIRDYLYFGQVSQFKENQNVLQED